MIFLENFYGTFKQLTIHPQIQDMSLKNERRYLASYQSEQIEQRANILIGLVNIVKIVKLL